MIDVNPILNNKFETFYGGKYSEEDAQILADFERQRDIINKRAPLDVKALIAGELGQDVPGVMTFVVTNEEMVKAAYELDPENPLWFDDERAQAAGFRSKPAWPSFASHDHAYTVPMPPELRDILMPNTFEGTTTWHAPIYEGDTLWFVCDHQNVEDVTPKAGSQFRSFAITSGGKVFNQNAELVAEYQLQMTESLRRIEDPEKRILAGSEKGSRHAKSQKVAMSEVEWECPDWWRRPAHFYSDAEYDKLRAIWAKEVCRGEQPLYWEDVNVGDRPAWTLEGPLRETRHPDMTHGMGRGSSKTRTLKRELMDPELCKRLLRGERDGIFYLPTDAPTDYTKDPDHDVYDYKDYRHTIINYYSRDCAIRMLCNWMGDKGRLVNVSWIFMPEALDYGVEQLGRTEHEPWRFLNKVPGMEGIVAKEHGLEGDVYIVKAYVTDKAIRDGKRLVDLVWWIQTQDDAYVTEGSATVELSSKDD